MGATLNHLEPREVFSYFEEITKVPRGSGNEKRISDYLVDFANKNNLEVIQDKAMNIIIKKPGTTGYENAPTVILQGHMDMVNEKNKGTEHDFDKDPLKLRIVDDMIYATGTTLGADNGIAIALSMTLLTSKDIPHPPLEVLITTEEETGMGGTMALDPNNINGRLLINIDSEEEGKLLVSCSGGIRITQKLNIKWEDADSRKLPYLLSVRGLKGGHSGMEINKGRGNSNKLIGRILNDISNEIDFCLASVNGGSKTNAIPREADAVIMINSSDASKLEEIISEWNIILKNELRTPDPDVTIVLEKSKEKLEKVFSKESREAAIASLVLIPNGIQSMSMDIPDLVESSTNLGVVITTDSMIEFQSSIRSSVKSLKYNILNHSRLLAKTLGADFISTSDYPEWQYNPDSKLRSLFERVYYANFHKAAEITAIHAGVECGLFGEKLEGLDMISIGPNLYDVHTPVEHLSISSTKRTWEYLTAVLKEMR
ncbi:MAG: pepD [Clostridiales bacterium]|nr:pepD [Clostridiales bacterium]